MLKLWLLKRKLATLGNACLWLSGGKDSTLLLHTLLSIKAKFAVVSFSDGLTSQQRRVVDELTIKHNLRVYKYPPAWSQMLGNELGDLALVSGYAVGSGGETAMLFRDVVPGERCAFDVPMEKGFRTPPMHFDVHIVGTKRGESHWALGERTFLASRRWDVGDVDFIAPLYSWTDKNVIDALKTFGVEYQEPSDERNSGNIVACSNCLHGINDVHCPKTGGRIKAVDWSPEGNLAAWQEAVGI